MTLIEKIKNIFKKTKNTKIKYYGKCLKKGKSKIYRCKYMCNKKRNRFTFIYEKNENNKIFECKNACCKGCHFISNGCNSPCPFRHNCKFIGGK